MQSIKSPWVDTFDQFASSIRESAIIATPFITREPVERLVAKLRSRQRSVQINLLTNLSPNSLIDGSLDGRAITWLCERVQAPRSGIYVICTRKHT